MSEDKRIAFWDIFKGVLIFLVVFTHFLYNYVELGYSKYLVNVIYFFHMPAFIFISGYFSKKEITFKKIVRYLLIYFIFNTIFVVYTAITTQTFLAITPFFSYWYLLALIAWRIIAKYIPWNKWYIVIPISFIISLLSGYFSDITNILAIEKIFGFLPFFFIGYYLPQDFIISFTKKRKLLVYISGFLIFIISMFSAYLISNTFTIQDYLLMETYNDPTDIFIRMLIYAIALTSSFGLFCMIPNKETRFRLIQKWGRNSLWIYMFHRPITLIFARIYPGPNNFYVIASLVATIIITMIFGSEKINQICNNCVDKLLSVILKK